MMPLDSAPLVLIFCVLLLAPQSTHTLSCPPCDREAACNNRAPVKCAYGRVLDACGCCTLCGNGPGEPCGGEFLMLGGCGKGLECRSNHATKVPEFAEGVCVHTKPWVPRMYKTQPYNKKGTRRTKPIKVIKNKLEAVQQEEGNNKLPPGLKIITPHHQPSSAPPKRRPPVKKY